MCREQSEKFIQLLMLPFFVCARCTRLHQTEQLKRLCVRKCISRFFSNISSRERERGINSNHCAARGDKIYSFCTAPHEEMEVNWDAAWWACFWRIVPCADLTEESWWWSASPRRGHVWNFKHCSKFLSIDFLSFASRKLNRNQTELWLAH